MTSSSFWQVESVRLTLFPKLNQRPSASESIVWSLISDAQPENRTERVQEGLVSLDGEWKSLRLTVSARPDRVDINLHNPNRFMELPSMGQPQESLELLRSLGHGVLSGFPGVVDRLAIGISVLHPEEGHKESYRTLNGLIDEVTINPNSRDFLYQINNPATSKTVPDLTLNIVKRWATILMRFFQMGSEGTALNSRYAVRFELDINSDPEYHIASKDIESSLLNEVIDSAYSLIVN